MKLKEKKILNYFRQLESNDQDALIAFAEFLWQRQGNSCKHKIERPHEIERPAGERVPAALKRLRKIYPMLDASELLSEASNLMSQYLVQGRAEVDVIDDLELLFRNYYQNYLDETKGK